ncbi:hypothetical protein E1I69_05200 [Bacillus timonensis]|uniref:HTH araC/xylS-type domain-containing protein n=1 Tax=Bacillus timonensis TaxID=1033734 RepID=A0A4S3PWI7_9BACI|nr:hypothetical protein [Bacillus timonensis]THE14210.1 hypothetical protein E1I69_05200 [Bacillus timonensis]
MIEAGVNINCSKTFLKQRRDWFIINRIRLNYTGEMEKAMHQAHGIGYEDYCRKFKERLRVEKTREQEYKQGRMIVAQFDRKVHF